MSEREQHHAGQPSPDLEETIIQILSFTHGSRIRLLVEAPADDIEQRFIDLGYYRHLFKPLDTIQE